MILSFWNSLFFTGRNCSTSGGVMAWASGFKNNPNISPPSPNKKSGQHRRGHGNSRYRSCERCLRTLVMMGDGDILVQVVGPGKTGSTITRWWQLKYLLFSPRKLGKWSNLTNIFQLGGSTTNQISTESYMRKSRLQIDRYSKYFWWCRVETPIFLKACFKWLWQAP